MVLTFISLAVLLHHRALFHEEVRNIPERGEREARETDARAYYERNYERPANVGIYYKYYRCSAQNHRISGKHYRTDVPLWYCMSVLPRNKRQPTVDTTISGLLLSPFESRITFKAIKYTFNVGDTKKKRRIQSNWVLS